MKFHFKYSHDDGQFVYLTSIFSHLCRFDGDGYVLYGHFVLSSLINYSAIQRVLLCLVVTFSNRKK